MPANSKSNPGIWATENLPELFLAFFAEGMGSVLLSTTTSIKQYKSRRKR